jgi:uncharacterized protein (DUF362 family)
MKRRDFLKSTIALAAAASLGGVSKLFAQGNTPDIAVVNGDRAQATLRAVEMLGGIGRFVKKGSKVVIKPNMSFNSKPEVGANTHPVVVAAIVQLCKDAGASKISVLDHCFSSNSPQASGILDACNKIMPDCVHHLSNSRFYKEVSIKNAKALSTTQVMQEVLEADVLIAVPKAKSHSAGGVSITLKGNMGLIYDRGYFHSHGLANCVADLYSILKPALTVIDASNVMTTNGPHGPGKVIEYNEIIASTDCVAADAYATISYEWYGQKVKAENVGYLKEAAARGLGRIDVDKLNVVKESV